MFWVAVKVIFLRQMYGLKHRWIMVLITVIYTGLLLLPLTLERRGLQQPDQSMETAKFDETESFPNPLTIMVAPDDMKTQELIIKAYNVLENEYGNSSLFNVHVTFMKEFEHMRRALEKSVWPSIGIEFTEISGSKLEYTLHPVIAPYNSYFLRKIEPSTATSLEDNEELVHGLLQLQAAIDTAYIHKHFPERGGLQIRSFPKTPFGDSLEKKEVSPWDQIIVFNAALLIALSLLMMMVMLASYIIRDKLSGVRELFCVNGIPRWMVNASWLTLFVILGLILAGLQVALIRIPHPNQSIKYISQPVLLLCLILYGWTALVFVNFVANVFTSQLLAILLIVLYWLVSTFVAIGVVQNKSFDELFVAQGFLSIVPNVGYILFFKVLLEFYAVETELSFGNLFFSPNKYISAGVVLLMMLTGVFIFLALALYLDAVKPGPYGRARPWYLFNFKRETANVSTDNTDSMGSNRFYEKTNGDEPVGLKCVNLTKIFGTHKALNNINLNFTKNRVTVLLGHNGAGKTTLFSILCGMFSPTQGDVFTDEYSIFEGNNISKFRRVLGYCPQENLVLNELSVREHLIIFGMLKGLSKFEAGEFSDKWTQTFDMYHLRNTLAKKLSGGTKRKLCLAIAMTGEPEYLLLDEPSAGMDIESTRKMWDVLLEEKGNCTVVITTHNMDEAEILGDRIAILAHGRLECLGSSSFLKKTLDSGYRLNCAVTNKNTEDVIRSVNRTIRGVSVLYKTNRSVTFSLPSNQINSIPDLLRGLEREFGETVSSTLALSTLDDVFIKVQKNVGVKVNVDQLPTIPKDEMSRSSWNCTELFWKRVKWLSDSSRLATIVMFVILLPNLAVIGGIFAIYDTIKDVDKPIDAVSISSGELQGMFALLPRYHDEVSDSLRSALSKKGVRFKEASGDINTTLIDIAQRDALEYKFKLLFAFDTHESDRPTAYFTSRTGSSVSIAYSALVNAWLKGDATIVTHCTPISHQKSFKDVKVRCIGGGPILPLMFFMIAGPFFLVACAYFVVFPHEERTSLFKHLQLMTGLLPVSYWIMNLLFDLLIYIFCCLLTAVVIASLNHRVNLFLDPTVFIAIMLTLVLYGLSGILLSYVGSFFFRSSAIPIVMITLGTLLLSFIFAMINKGSEFAVKKIVYFEWSFFLPWPVLWNSLHKILLWAINKRDCDKCKLEVSCDYMKNGLFQKELKVEFICFLALAVVYFLILIILDHGLGMKLIGLVQWVCCGKIKIVKQGVDPEVALEEQRVNSLGATDKNDWPELVCDGLGKKYSCTRTAVYNVTFTAERGECFGLVGVNGAGKTTTFGMLSALLNPTKGTAVIEGRWKVTGCNYCYLKRVGYCPQYGGLLGELPARTVIRLFGRLGGVPRSQIGPLVDKWINALDMADIAKRPCGHYSGGNKRKLSLAIALIGNPPVVLLDEPTAGVDPIVRRKIWEILTTSLEQHERTIILTSHTMSECEAICDRLTIMVKGVMKCLGPISVLKKSFGKSFILEVKLTTNSTNDQQSSVRSKIESQFAAYIHFQDAQPSRLVFLLKTENVKMYDLFAAMLRIQSDNSVIEDFNLSETPLEQVFLMFAQDKKDKKGKK